MPLILPEHLLDSPVIRGARAVPHCHMRGDDVVLKKKDMETFNNNNRQQNRHMVVGIFLLVVGAVFMMKSIGFMIPFWVLSWHTILLTIGILIGFRKNFIAGGWVILVLVGGIFTLKEVLFFDISGYTTAMLFMGLGLYMIFKPKKELHFCDFSNRKHKANLNL